MRLVKADVRTSFAQRLNKYSEITAGLICSSGSDAIRIPIKTPFRLAWAIKEVSVHTMQSVFKQLGLDNSESGVKQFIDTHKLSRGEALEQAAFWSNSQAAFIRESWQMDADWVGVIEQLNVALRKLYPQIYR